MASTEPAHLGSVVGRHLAHASSAGFNERTDGRMYPVERTLRGFEAVHGGGVHGSGVWTNERALNDWHLQNSIKYAGPFHPEYSSTPVPMSKVHAGMHDAALDFKTAVRGIVPGYAGHVPRARDMYGEPSSGGITPERGWKRNERTGQMLETTNRGPMGARAYDANAQGASSRPHAFTRRHNCVSDEVKPGYAGHVPQARDTHGTSFYRDSFTHRTGATRHKEVRARCASPYARAVRWTSRARQPSDPLRRAVGPMMPPCRLAVRHSLPTCAQVEDGATSARSTSSMRFGSRSYCAQTPAHPPGLRDRERITGRPVSARRSHPTGRYFTLDQSPRRVVEVSL